MAEIEFIMTKEDSVEFASFLFKEFNAQLSMDDTLSDEPVVFKSVKELTEFVNNQKYYPLLFVTSKDWGGHTLYKDKVEKKDGNIIYYIMQRYGSPSFCWMPSRTLIKNGTTYLIQGMIGDYPWFYLKPGSDKTIDRPASMIDAYKKISKFIKSKSVRSYSNTSNKPGPWVSHSSLEFISNGAILGGYNQWKINK